MTRMMVEPASRWGEARAAEQTARKRRRRLFLFAAWGGILIVAAPLSIVSGDLGMPGPRTMAQIAAILIFLTGGIVIWRNWQDADEMQRRLATQTWAIIGVLSFVLQPIINIGRDWSGYVGWGNYNCNVMIALAVGLLFYAYRRVRS